MGKIKSSFSNLRKLHKPIEFSRCVSCGARKLGKKLKCKNCFKREAFFSALNEREEKLSSERIFRRKNR